mmetsp:Transcript_4580/g.12163  ORF Transcript_4580/g.12163 Transcript_4580/m.12163 type:complete len:244 (+) Transcript_4580:403-1134(+)
MLSLIRLSKRDSSCTAQSRTVASSSHRRSKATLVSESTVTGSRSSSKGSRTPWYPHARSAFSITSKIASARATMASTSRLASAFKAVDRSSEMLLSRERTNVLACIAATVGRTSHKDWRRAAQPLDQPSLRESALVRSAPRSISSVAIGARSPEGPDFSAMTSAVLPSLSADSRDAPLSMNIAAMCAWPRSVARMSAVQPSSSAASREASLAKRSVHTSTWPFLAASRNAVHWCSSEASIEAP